MVRGKFRCASVMFYGADLSAASNRQFTFSAVYDTDTPENQRFSQATPWGELKMNVSNPDVDFEAGKQYYLDFTPID